MGGDVDADSLRAWACVMDTLAVATGALRAEAWIVGGALRDIALGLPVGDLDLTVTCPPSALAAALAGEYRPTVAHLNRSSLRLNLHPHRGKPSLQLDLSPLHGPDIATDLAQRDFTCNALALPLSSRAELLVAASARHQDPFSRRGALPSLLDLLGGLRDIEERILRPASSTSFTDEPGRIIRAARMLAAFGFSASAELCEFALQAAPLLTHLTSERICAEMDMLLALPACAEGLRFLADVGALAALVPALADEPARSHVVASVAATRQLQDNVGATQNAEPLGNLASLAPLRERYASALPSSIPRIVALRWGLLLHTDMPGDESGHSARLDAKAPTWLRLSKQVRATVAAVAESSRWRRLLMDGDPSLPELRAAADRWQDGFVDLLVGAAACDAGFSESLVPNPGARMSVARRAGNILERFVADREAFIPPPLLDGQAAIHAIGAVPGPELGRVLREVRRAQLAGIVATQEEAFALARRLIESA